MDVGLFWERTYAWPELDPGSLSARSRLGLWSISRRRGPKLRLASTSVGPKSHRGVGRAMKRGERVGVNEKLADNLARTERERVGKKFRRRTSPNDSGMIGEVVALSRDDPTRNVLTEWSSPSGRQPHQDDYPEDRPTSIEWRRLVMSQAEQIHYTSRMVVRSQNLEGWVEFEAI